MSRQKPRPGRSALAKLYAGRKLGRCPDCGGKVFLPCEFCRAQRIRAGVKLVQDLTEKPRD